MIRSRQDGGSGVVQRELAWSARMLQKYAAESRKIESKVADARLAGKRLVEMISGTLDKLENVWKACVDLAEP